MIRLVDRDQFNANSLSKQLKLMKKANPPPKLEEHKIFEGVSKAKKKSQFRKQKLKTKGASQKPKKKKN